ncbi:hypothetical protein LTR85_007253 [Meristemomyces frigidus]|nr:hypothetical protein LTR85_007253 [Meristemomyces frigidus]
MATKCILLTGAPEADSLKWDEGASLSEFESPVKRFLGHSTAAPGTSVEASTYELPKWRAVPMSARASDTNDYADEDGRPQTQFLPFGDDVANGKDRLQFLEQSLARLTDLDSSQIAPVADDTTFISAGSFTTSFDSTSYPTSYGSFSTTSPTQGTASTQQQQLHFTGTITDIKRIPSADHLLRLAPQTITVNLLAAVITVSPSRTVRLRKRSGEMDIIELLVGDETRAGFSISFWLAPADSQRKDADDMRHILRQLRAGDVVLLQNIALSAFKDCVYGQSLSKRFARNSTSLAVLSQPQGLPAQLQAKYSSVRQWSYDFVGRDRERVMLGGGSGKRSGKRVREELPPDTQSPVKRGSAVDVECLERDHECGTPSFSLYVWDRRHT